MNYDHPNARKGDLIAISVYSVGVAVCFALSAVRLVAARCNRLDYFGIILLMWSAAVSVIYYRFSCTRTLRAMHWTLTTIVSLCCAIATLTPQFGLPRFRCQRTCLYAGLGLISAFSIANGVMVSALDAQIDRMSLKWLAWMATINITGAMIYAARIPERWASRRFDMFGASHQLFHVAVLAAAGVHFHGLSETFRAIRSKPDLCGGS
ncbi:hypothetical protein PCL_08343 [Purpureocillium lilacinum]|uniref:Adiponectin receptor protein 1 n=1 Tax=Purpureocillium lilacinum TaxID=33203 RepID=A0A2U3DRW9_PURLI|nr:hypothetical protein PCL_08343 [Purpureocillium lilacinum]